MNTYKIFAISDVHGHYTEMVNALHKSGFDENNPKHLLISCGDMFDRGEESLAVYQYLKDLHDKGKAVLIKGNHEPMFTSFLKGSVNPFNFIHNGTRNTIDDFYHCTKSFEMFMIENKDNYMYMEDAYCDFVKRTSKSINKEFPELINFIDNLPYYYETKNHIFTHAAIDLKVPDWHNPHCYRYDKIDWEALTWDDGSFITQKNTTDKTIVVGHFDSNSLRKMWDIDYNGQDNYSILKTDDNKVFIDACTILTKQINVYVIEDELLDERTEEN